MLTGIALLLMLFGGLYWRYRSVRPPKQQSRVDWVKVRHLEAVLDIEPMPRIDSEGVVIDAGPDVYARMTQEEYEQQQRQKYYGGLREWTYQDAFGDEQKVHTFEPW